MALGTQQQKTIIAISKCEYRGVLIYETATGCTVILGGKQHDFISLGEATAFIDSCYAIVSQTIIQA